MVAMCLVSFQEICAGNERYKQTQIQVYFGEVCCKIGRE